MRRIFAIVALSLHLAGSDIPWTKDFETAKQAAATEKKIVLLMFTQSGCPTCTYMEKNTFTDTAVIDYIRFHFVPVKLDIYSDTIPEGFRPLGTPTFYFTDGSGKKIARKIFGGAKAADFLRHLQNVRNDYLKNKN